MTRIRVPLGKFIKEYSERNKGNEDIPVYSVTNSQGFCTEYFGKEVASQDKTTYKIVPQGYFAYNPSRINVGSVDWQRYEKRVIVSPLYNVFSVSEGIDRQYLYYFLRSDLGRQMIKAKASGSVRDNLKLDMLKEMTIPDISVEQQKFCSSVLDKLHKLICVNRNYNSWTSLSKPDLSNCLVIRFQILTVYQKLHYLTWENLVEEYLNIDQEMILSC